MKPLYLEMEGYGPYAKKTVIDINKLPDNLTLISGNTGAGKTTIFDAICCALFGESSGKGRSFKQMRSDFITSNKPTKVTFKFKIKDQDYKIIRHAPYDKKKKDSEETTFVNAKAELILPDSSVITGVKNVNEKINEILGIGQDEFRQIVMIAQNDFMAMIKEAGKKQEKIFNRIFNASLYENFAHRIFEKFKEYRQKTQIDAEKIVSALNSAGFDSKSLEIDQSNINISQLKEYLKIRKKEIGESYKEANDDLNEKKDNLRKIERKRTQATQLIEEFNKKEELERSLKSLLSQKEKIKQLEEKKEWAAKARDIVEGSYLNYQRVNESLHDLNETKRLKETELIQKEEIYHQISQKFKEYSQEKLNDLYRSYKKLSEELPKYEKLADLKSLTIDDKKEEKNLNQKLKETEEYLKKARQEKESLIIKPDEFFKAQEDRLNLKLNSVEKNLLEIKSLVNDYNSMAQLLFRLKEDRKTLSELSESTERVKNRYNEAFKNYISNQAAFLAENLKEGEPCPVCGSKEHPKLAKFAAKSITKEELDQLKEKLDQKEKSLREESEKFNSLRQNYEFLLDKLKNSLEKLGNLDDSEKEIFSTCLVEFTSFGTMLDKGQEISSFTLNSETLQTTVQNLGRINKRRLQELQEDIKENEKALNLNHETKTRYEKLEKEIIKLEKDFSESEKSLRDKQEQIIKIETQLKTLQDECIYPSLYEAQNKCKVLKNKYDNYKRDFEQIRDEKEKAGKILDSLKGELKNLDSQLRETETQLKQKREELNLSLKKGGFESEEIFLNLRLEPQAINELTKEIENYNNQCIQLKTKKQELDKSLENSATRF